MTDCVNLSYQEIEKFLVYKNSTAVFHETFAIIFGGYDGQNYTNQILKYDIQQNKFSTVNSTLRPAARAQHTACILNNKMYVFGGMSNTQTFDDLWEFDLQTMQFKPIKYDFGRVKPSALYGHCMCPLSPTELLICGGCRDNAKLETLFYIYDITQNVLMYQLTNDGPEPTIGAQLINLNNNCYLFGGIGLKGFTNEVWKIGQNRKWTQLRIQKNQPQARAQFLMQPLGDDKFVIYGGENGKLMSQKMNDMWVFIPEQLTWVKIGEPKLQARSAQSGICWKSHSGNYRVVVFGGSGRQGFCKDIWSILMPKNFQEEAKANEGALLKSQADAKPDVKEEIVHKAEPVAVKVTEKKDDLNLGDLRPQNSFEQPIPQQAKPIVKEIPVVQQVAPVAQNSNVEQMMKVQQEINKRLDQVVEQMQSLQQNELELKQMKTQLNQLQTQSNLLQKIPEVKEVKEKSDYSFRELNDLKVDVTTNLSKQFNTQLLQTQQELIQISKKLIADQQLQSQAEIEINSNNINLISNKQVEFEAYCASQFVKSSQIAQYDPKLSFLETQAKQTIQKTRDLDTQQQKFDGELQQMKNLIQDVEQQNSLKYGIEQLIDSKQVQLRQRLQKLEQQASKQEITNENTSLQMTQAPQSSDSKNQINVMNITDEVFVQKLRDNMHILQNESKSDFEALIDAKLKNFKEYELKLIIENSKQPQQYDLIAKINSQLSIILAKMQQFEEKQEAVVLLQNEVSFLKQQMIQMAVDMESLKPSNDLYMSTHSMQPETPKKQVKFSDSLQEELKESQLSTKHVTAQNNNALEDYMQQSLSTSTRLKRTLMYSQKPVQKINVQNWTDAKYSQKLLFDAQTVTTKMFTSMSGCAQTAKIATCDGQFVKIFDISSQMDQDQAERVIAADEPVTRIQLLCDNLYLGMKSGSVKFTQNDEDVEFCAFQTPISSLFAFQNSDVNYTLAGCDGGQLGLWEPLRNEFNLIGAIQSKISALALTGEHCCCGDSLGIIKIFDLIQQKEITQLGGHSGEIVQFSCPGQQILSASLDGSVRIHDQRTPKCVLQGHAPGCTGVWSDGQIVISSGKDGFLRVWDIRGGEKQLNALKMDDAVSLMEVVGDLVCTSVGPGCINAIDFR
ncbi:Kelch_repeat-containing protein [Hexamita inflata]|uniref:Kelch repeat-containing protein n=1 Tax=Hexamita inflata TaxID=28002 RepID=A0AA86N6Z2_9EUKA|nr:Kelch repeat-containing protein [Hexamita inflata]